MHNTKAQHIRQWILDCWVGVHPDDLNTDLPNFPGLYSIIAGDSGDSQTIVYVGMTKRSLRERFSKHHRWTVVELLSTLSIPVYIYYWAVPYVQEDEVLSVLLLKWERELIVSLQPVLNGASVSLIDRNNNSMVSGNQSSKLKASTGNTNPQKTYAEGQDWAILLEEAEDTDQSS